MVYPERRTVPTRQVAEIVDQRTEKPTGRCVAAIALLNLDPPTALYEVERRLRADGTGDRRATVAERRAATGTSSRVVPIPAVTI